MDIYYFKNEVSESILLISIICLLFIFSAFDANAEIPLQEKKIYNVGVIPQFKAHRINQVWQPLLKKIEGKSNL